MIELSGLVPDHDIPIRFTGLRPGEKLYEELLIDPETASPTKHPRIYCSNEPIPEHSFLQDHLQKLEEAVQSDEFEKTMEILKTLVPEYSIPSRFLPQCCQIRQSGYQNRKVVCLGALPLPQPTLLSPWPRPLPSSVALMLIPTQSQLGRIAVVYQAAPLPSLFPATTILRLSRFAICVPWSQHTALLAESPKYLCILCPWIR